ncbi:MAG: peptidase S53 [Acidobacteria bacterium]|nr:MAG: peptidase S53 [Acidobacteriota bacterium]
MSSPKDRIPVPGSERAPLPGARAVGAANPDESIQVTVLLRPRAAKDAPNIELLASRMPQERQHMTREDLGKNRGADPQDIAKIEAFAHDHRLAVVEANPAERRVVLSGTVASFNQAFDVDLQRFEHPQGSYRGRTGPVHIPADIADIVQGVFGLDNRPQAKAHFQRTRRPRGLGARTAGTSFTPTQIADLYNFPSGDGTGQCIALIELGGGYRPRDLKTYFDQLGLPHPTVRAVSVDGGHNHPGSDADGEVMLDIEVAAGVAPKSKVIVYFAPNTDQGFLDAIIKAVHDKQHNPSVISISWGGPESAWTTQALQAFDQAFQDAAAVGVTVCCAAGDNGSTDGVNDGLQHVDFPASSPFALACGGTSLQASGKTISSETVWDDAPTSATGGGISDFFPLPGWQSGTNVPSSANPDHHKGRGLPDIAGDADPNTGYAVIVDGQQEVIGGTSAVAPLWAGLIARINQQLGNTLGYLNPLLYGPLSQSGALHDITQGNNGTYTAGIGWDPCTGWGTPDGTRLLSALTPKAAAKAAGKGSKVA